VFKPEDNVMHIVNWDLLLNVENSFVELESCRVNSKDLIVKGMD
jgi:hypothetical protein